MNAKKKILSLLSFLAVFAVSAVAYAQGADVEAVKASNGGWSAGSMA